MADPLLDLIEEIIAAPEEPNGVSPTVTALVAAATTFRRVA
mgnify:CR=1 FL=1